MSLDWSQVYVELKGWQSGIGAIIGFGGLVGGALFNAHLNRKRDERLRDDEAKAVASALYGEIALQRRSIARMANAVAHRYVNHGVGKHRGDEPFDRHLLEQIALPALRLYPALAAKIGLLPAQLALEVVRFYARAEEAQTWLHRLPSDPDRPFTYSVNYVLDPALEAVTGVLPALRLMEGIAGIPTEEESPDIKFALSVQEMENI